MFKRIMAINWDVYIPNCNEPLEKNIWIYWDDLNNCPLIVKSNIKCIQTLYTDWTINILSNKNVHEYIPPNISDLAKSYSVQHRCDLYRLYLLKIHGGLWLDSSILIKDKKFVDKFYNVCKSENKVGVYETTFPYKNSTNFPVIENWFIMSPKPNHYIINLWYNEYVKALAVGFKKYKKHIEKEVVVNHIYPTKDNVYLTMHACIQRIIQLNRNILKDMIILKSYNDMFYIQTKLNFDNTHLKDTFIEIFKTLPCIKLRGCDRDKLSDIDISDYYEIN